MGLKLEYIIGQTPLDDDEKDGLLIRTIKNRKQLDESEQQNIEKAIIWTLKLSATSKKILTNKFVCDVHKKMYSDVWAWSGQFRKTNKNLGVDKWQIPTALKSLIDDTKYWIDEEIYSPDEIAIRFKHRIVSIHCFPNGNGRHSRLMADIIIQKIFKRSVFTWGTKSLSKHIDARVAYLEAIREADKGNLELLLDFARS